MEKIREGLEGFVLADWLGTPYRGKGRGTFVGIWSRSYLRGTQCGFNTALLLCALDSRGSLERYRQNLTEWYASRKYVGGLVAFEVEPITRQAVVRQFRILPSPAHSGCHCLIVASVLAFTPLPVAAILSFVRTTHNSRHSLSYSRFWLELVRALRSSADKHAALAAAERRSGVRINRQNFSNGSFVGDMAESAVNWFLGGGTYEDCVFAAVNAGQACDVAAALTGLLAGLHHGIRIRRDIPSFGELEPYLSRFVREVSPSG